jgi:lysozyme
MPNRTNYLWKGFGALSTSATVITSALWRLAKQYVSNLPLRCDGYKSLRRNGENIVTTTNPLVIDLSHWDPAYDYAAVKADGIVGVIYKATEGQSYRDSTYVEQRQEAKAVGLKWGAYHFADGSDASGQVRNFMSFACPDPDELFVLDWEDNPSGSGKMSVEQAKQWIEEVEHQLGRPNECVIYGGNTLKELIDGYDPFFAARRLWLCQYGDQAVLPESWSAYWLWQFTDGVYGPSPHSIDGVGPCDINSYEGSAEQLVAEWTKSKEPPRPRPEPALLTVNMLMAVSEGITVIINGKIVDIPNLSAARRAWAAVRAHRVNREAK